MRILHARTEKGVQENKRQKVKVASGWDTTRSAETPQNFDSVPTWRALARPLVRTVVVSREIDGGNGARLGRR